MHHRFLSKRPAFFPEKMCLELAEALHIDRELWIFSLSVGNCAQETFRGHLDSEQVKFTVICIAAIATLPRTSFQDNNFASCLFTHYVRAPLSAFGRPCPQPVLRSRLPKAVGAILAKEVSLGNMAGPFTDPPYSPFHCSGLGTVEKADGTQRVTRSLVAWSPPGLL